MFLERINSKRINAWSEHADVCFHRIAISHHESTNTTYLFNSPVKTFNSPMSIMNCNEGTSGYLLFGFFIW